MLSIENLIKLFASNQETSTLDMLIDIDQWNIDNLDTMVNPFYDFAEQIKKWNNVKLCSFIFLCSEHPRTPAGCYNYGNCVTQNNYLAQDFNMGMPYLMDHSEVLNLVNILAMTRNIIPLY